MGTDQPVRRRPLWMRVLLVFLLLLLLAAAGFCWRPFSTLQTGVRIWLRFHGVHSEYAQAGPYRIHYLVAGSGQPIVLLHGMGSQGQDWGGTIVALAKSEKVYAIDMIGHGDSDKPVDADYSIALQARVVRDFLDSQHIERADVVGISMGGMTALRFAAEYPQRVRRLVVSGAPAIGSTPAVSMDVYFPQTEAELRDFNHALTPLEWNLPGFVARDYLRYRHPTEWVMRRVLDGVLRNRAALANGVDQIKVPVLLVWGDKDLVAPLSGEEYLHTRMPQSDVVILTGCGHVAVHDCSGEATPAIRRFFLADAPPVGEVRRIAHKARLTDYLGQPDEN